MIGDDEINLVGSVTEVAVTMTVPPPGTLVGAVYVVGVVLGVEVGRKPPHCDVGVHDQLTPWFLGSLVTVAAMPHCSLRVTAVGGKKPEVKVTDTAGAAELEFPQPLSVAAAQAIITKTFGRWSFMLDRAESSTDTRKSRLGGAPI